MSIRRTSKLDTKTYFNRCLFIDKENRISDNLIDLACIQNTLTFDSRFLDRNFKSISETPFLEISYLDTRDIYQDFIPENTFSGSYESYLHSLISTMKSLIMGIDSSREYLFCHSSGSDSRIISGVMSELRESGKEFDNVSFYCWGRPEKEQFIEIMDRCGWKKYSFLDDHRDNAFGIGDPSVSVGGWNSYQGQFKFWGDLDTSKFILLSGAEGETFTRAYPDWIHSRGYFMDRGESIHRLSNVFSGIFLPYLSKDFLNLTMSMPKEWRNIPDKRIDRDKVRTDLVELLGLSDIPPAVAAYNLNVTPDLESKMISLYENSQFHKDFKEMIDSSKLYTHQGGWDACAWGFAVTVYEPIMAARSR